MSVPRPNGGGATDRITVPCGKCIACLSRKRTEWSFRINQELKSADTAHFITLTYSDENINTALNLSKKDVQTFLKRLRYYIDQWVKLPENEGKQANLRYYLIGEYGPTTLRPHYHGIFFNIPVGVVNDSLTKAWPNGFIKVGNVTEASVNYCTKYLITKNEAPPEREAPFSLMSRKPAIGDNYLNATKDWHRKHQRFFAVANDGIKVNLPRYYRTKIFNELETKVNNLKQVQLNDEKIIKEHDRIISLGNDSVGEYEMLQKQQITENKLKSLKKSSKL